MTEVRSRPSRVMGEVDPGRRILRTPLRDPRPEGRGEGSDDPPGDTLMGEAEQRPPRYASKLSPGSSSRSVAAGGGGGGGSVTTNSGSGDPCGREVNSWSSGQSSPRVRSGCSPPRAPRAPRAAPIAPPHPGPSGGSTLMVGGEKVVAMGKVCPEAG